MICIYNHVLISIRATQSRNCSVMGFILLRSRTSFISRLSMRCRSRSLVYGRFLLSCKAETSIASKVQLQNKRAAIPRAHLNCSVSTVYYKCHNIFTVRRACRQMGSGVLFLLMLFAHNCSSYFQFYDSDNYLVVCLFLFAKMMPLTATNPFSYINFLSILQVWFKLKSLYCDSLLTCGRYFFPNLFYQFTPSDLKKIFPEERKLRIP